MPLISCTVWAEKVTYLYLQFFIAEIYDHASLVFSP